MASNNKLGTHQTTINPIEPNGFAIRYHSTDVVRVFPDRIELNHGGYVTTTTKRRMNQASNVYNLGYQVFSRKGTLYVTFKGIEHRFIENTFTLWLNDHSDNNSAIQ